MVEQSNTKTLQTWERTPSGMYVEVYWTLNADGSAGGYEVGTLDSWIGVHFEGKIIEAVKQ